MNRFDNISRTGRSFMYALPLLIVFNTNAGTLCTGSCQANTLTAGGSAIVIYPVVPPLVNIQLPPAVLAFEMTPTLGASGWQYGFSAFSTVSVTIPYFSDSFLSGITEPTDWSLSIGTTDVFGLGNGAGFMTWSFTGITAPISPTTLLPMFSFQSLYAPGVSPSQFVLTDGTIVNLSGFGLVPLSPQALAAGLQPYNIAAVPEPEIWELFIIGLIFFYFSKMHRVFTRLPFSVLPSA